jgi:hypothetical protein
LIVSDILPQGRDSLGLFDGCVERSKQSAANRHLFIPLPAPITLLLYAEADEGGRVAPTRECILHANYIPCLQVPPAVWAMHGRALSLHKNPSRRSDISLLLRLDLGRIEIPKRRPGNVGSANSRPTRMEFGDATGESHRVDRIERLRAASVLSWLSPSQGPTNAVPIAERRPGSSRFQLNSRPPTTTTPCSMSFGTAPVVMPNRINATAQRASSHWSIPARLRGA